VLVPHFRLNLTSAHLVLVAALLVPIWGADARADPTTVCTITVNSADEKETIQRSLPEGKYRFVELVEKGRADWLASACRQGIKCDVVVISGHFDGVSAFYSDAVATREFLPVAEMERASCSDSCPGLFSQLKEVYLFGCNTLNAEAVNGTSTEISRMLKDAGRSRAEADRLMRVMTARHGESSRERMRGIFANVPVIYGFSSVAPLGPTAANLLSRHFQSASRNDFGTGRVSPGLLGHFAGHSMTVASGLRDSDPQAAYRRQACQFVDDRLSAANKLAFIHGLLRGDIAEVHLFFDRIEQYFATLSEAEQRTPAFELAHDGIVADATSRDRYLDFARNAEEPRLRARMIELAGTLGWLSADAQQLERSQMIAERLASASMSGADVDLICALNKDHTLDGELSGLQLMMPRTDGVPQAAALACLGSVDGRVRVLQALAGSIENDVRIAQVYLRHRPIEDVAELRELAVAIGQMTGSESQVRALDTLAQQRVSDPESLDEVARLYPLAKSVNVQRAIAGILIRSDYDALEKPELVRLLREHRLKSPDGNDLIDTLIRRLSAA